MNGRIVTVTELLEGSETTTDYQYDAAGRLVHATVATDGAPTAHRSYSYDPNGNRIGFEATGIDAEGIELTGEYDAQDRLLRYGTKSYALDPNGNLVSVTDRASGSTTLYDYDELGQLQEVTLPNGRAISYAYDLVGRRTAKRVDGLFQEGYLWLDELRPLAKLGPDGQLVQQYVYGEGVNVPDLILSSGRTFRLVHDQVGSVRLVVDTETGDIVQKLDYDEFGRVLQDSNPELQPFGFAGGLYDPETGLVRFGARDYDSETGRWTAKDPIRWDGGQANLYVYVGNDPINRTDPSGEIGPVDFVMCLYYEWRASDAMEECQREVANAWLSPGDELFGDGCELTGGSPSDQYLNCLKHKDSDAVKGFFKWCSRTAVSSAGIVTGRAGAVSIPGRYKDFTLRYPGP